MPDKQKSTSRTKTEYANAENEKKKVGSISMEGEDEKSFLRVEKEVFFCCCSYCYSKNKTSLHQ